MTDRLLFLTVLKAMEHIFVCLYHNTNYYKSHDFQIVFDKNPALSFFCLFPKINWAYKLMFFYSFYDFRSEVEVVLPIKMKERMNMTSWARQSFDNGTLTRNNCILVQNILLLFISSQRSYKKSSKFLTRIPQDYHLAKSCKKFYNNLFMSTSAFNLFT